MTYGIRSFPFYVFMFIKIEIIMKTTWNDLNIKEKIAICTAIIAFLLGWAMSIGAFFVPPMGEVADSILWILGQALLYSSAVFGVSAYFRSETVQLRRDLDRHLEHMERMQIEREKLRKGLDVPELPTDKTEDEE